MMDFLMSEKTDTFKPENGKFFLGIFVIFGGLVVLFLYPINFGTAIGSVILALAMGLYFLGINLMLSSKLKNDPQLQELSDRIEALSQNLKERGM